MKKIVLSLLAILFLSSCGEQEAKIGDTVSIHFEGFLNDIQFPGGTGDFELKLGSGQFVPGFEDQLVGAKKGEVREVKLRFPDKYLPGLAGQNVTFKVTVKDIK
ncbi:MAG: FKBP-type peptidyl-prolyl cis-trans isomerase [Rickettsiales bacterium]|jgi:trigger factor|nr:FKBP-type peptidyl-prolyl cis-trans isomerase [Rickettsiales bacterium]